MKENTGITLIALVITIIVLLILAAVSIATLTGENGILTQANKAKVETRGASVEEECNLWKINREMDSKTTEETAQTLDELLDSLEARKLITAEERVIIEETGEITIGSKTINFGKEKEVGPTFTNVANAPDVSGFNINNTYYIAWNINEEGTEYVPNEVAMKKDDKENYPPENWYDYTSGVNHWANVKTTGGENDCYWVWVPRYAYQVPDKLSNRETINIKFLEGTSNIPIGETKSEEITNKIPTQGTWVVHPAFWWDKNNNGVEEDGEQLTGIWVAKFEASSNIVNEISIKNGELVGDTASLTGVGGGNVTNLQVRVKPNVTSWREITVNNIFKVCQNLTSIGNSLENTNNLDAHMMKNIEWGAVAYLSSSIYGNRERIYSNPYYNSETNLSPITGLAGKEATQVNNGNIDNLYMYNTEGGIKASTTGNVYGIYDMAGGVWEYVAGYLSQVPVADDSPYSVLANANLKYKDVYTGTSNNGEENYNENSGKYGDAVYETSVSGGDIPSSWDNVGSWFPYSINPIFTRGNHAVGGNKSGIFAFARGNGIGANSFGFRPSVVKF